MKKWEPPVYELADFSKGLPLNWPDKIIKGETFFDWMNGCVAKVGLQIEPEKEGIIPQVANTLHAAFECIERLQEIADEYAEVSRKLV